jgi:probable HAF family extracellular repeat protein
LGGDLSIGNAMSDTGVVVGGSQTAGDFNLDAFVTTKTGLKDLGTLGGQFSNASGVNVLLQVVGSSTLVGEASTHAFYWDAKHGMMDLGTLGGSNSAANAISPLGVVAGSADLADGLTTDLALWNTKGIHDLGNLGGGFAAANSVSALGQAAGYSTTASGETHAVITSKSGLQDLGTLGGTVSVANGIYPLGGIVVGTYTDANDIDNLAFVWTSKKGMVDLNTLIPAGSGWVLQSATSITVLGQIVGNGAINGAQHAFLLTLK